jgi:hypothetical protein
MVSRKTGTGTPQEGAAVESARQAGQAAQAMATATAPAPTGRKPQAGTLLTLRIDPTDKAMLQETFENCGVKLASGMKLSALYVLQEIKAGRLVMTKAGLFP